MGAPHWLLVFAVILGAWGLLYAMSLPADLRNAGAVYGRDFWQDQIKSPKEVASNALRDLSTSPI